MPMQTAKHTPPLWFKHMNEMEDKYCSCTHKGQLQLRLLENTMRSSWLFELQALEFR